MPTEHEELKKLLEENLAIAKENHKLLQKMHRIEMYAFWIRFLWFAIIIGVPFLTYYFFVEPYLHAVGVSSDDFGNMLKNLPHLINSPFLKVL